MVGATRMTIDPAFRLRTDHAFDRAALPHSAGRTTKGDMGSWQLAP